MELETGRITEEQSTPERNSCWTGWKPSTVALEDAGEFEDHRHGDDRGRRLAIPKRRGEIGMSRRRPAFFDQPQDCKLLLFGGKGGVGKTTCATAPHCACPRSPPKRSLLLVSTDPAHSVRDSHLGRPCARRQP